MRTPHFLEWGYRTPHFLGQWQKKYSDFPSSSAHVSPYNVQEKVWGLGLCPRNWVHRRSQRGIWGAWPTKGSVENSTTVLAVQKGQIYYIRESLVFSNFVHVNVTQYVPQKCQI